MMNLPTPLEIAPGLTLLGYCRGCGGSKYTDTQLPLCGWCVMRRLREHPDEELSRRRVYAAEEILALYRNKTIRQVTDYTTAELSAIRRNIAERMRKIFLAHGGMKWRDRRGGRPRKLQS